MRRWFAVLAFLTSCAAHESSSPSDDAVYGLSVKKQKQRLTVLQKKLEFAEREYKKTEEEVERLHDEVHKTRLAIIRRQIDLFEKQLEKAELDPQKLTEMRKLDVANLFLEEREALHLMIQNGPSPSAFDAQLELDRILRAITQISDRSSPPR